ncbi:unnamed protein product [Rotaria socialis]
MMNLAVEFMIKIHIMMAKVKMHIQYNGNLRQLQKNKQSIYYTIDAELLLFLTCLATNNIYAYMTDKVEIWGKKA